CVVVVVCKTSVQCTGGGVGGFVGRGGGSGLAVGGVLCTGFGFNCFKGFVILDVWRTIAGLGGCGCCFTIVGDLVRLPFFFLACCQGVMESESEVEESDSNTTMGVSESGSSLIVTVTGLVGSKAGGTVELGVPAVGIQRVGSCAGFCACGVGLPGWEEVGVGGLVRGMGVGGGGG
ncbi:hypothetical protein ANANG_G00298780, partial [Anguilla anguilla]